MPATRSAGSWLTCRRGDVLVAFAPPGVVVDDSHADQLGCWREAHWRTNGDPTRRPPLLLATRTVAEVLASVPADYRRWVEDATREQVQTLTWFIATAPGNKDEGSARRARETRDRLTAELGADRETYAPSHN